jgi:hypothetical protein
MARQREPAGLLPSDAGGRLPSDCKAQTELEAKPADVEPDQAVIFLRPDASVEFDQNRIADFDNRREVVGGLFDVPAQNIACSAP